MEQSQEIRMLLQALKDPSNKPLRERIIQRLSELGVTRDELLDYFELTKPERPSWPDGPDRHSFEKRHLKAMRNILVCGTLLVLMMVGLMIGVLMTGDDPKDATVNPPAITDSAPVSDGDKL